HPHVVGEGRGSQRAEQAHPMVAPEPDDRAHHREREHEGPGREDTPGAARVLRPPHTGPDRWDRPPTREDRGRDPPSGTGAPRRGRPRRLRGRGDRPPALPLRARVDGGGMIDEVRRVLDGRKLYDNPTLDYVPFIYTPLWFYLAAASSLVFGVG